MATHEDDEPEIPHSESRKSQVTEKATWIIKLPLFEKATLVMIMSYAVWIGIDVDWNEEGSPVPNVLFVVIENAYCGAFVLEIIIRFLTYEPKREFFTHPQQGKYNTFDLFLVMIMVLEVWILAPLSLATSIHRFALLRLLRLMRLLRISRIFRMVPELGMMVRTLAKAARTVSSTLLLEIMIMYGFAVIFTQWSKFHEDPCFAEIEDKCLLPTYFGSILRSLVTFMQILIFDDTFAIIRPILGDTWYMGCLLMLFILVGGWTVLNMLIGIICEIITTSTAEEKMKVLEQRVREIFTTMDLDGSGTVTREEFAQSKQQLLKLGIHHGIWHKAFDILDEDGSGSFDVDEFLRMVFKLLNPPQSQDVQEMNSKLSKIASALNVSFESQSLSFSAKKSTSRIPSMTSQQSRAEESMSPLPQGMYKNEDRDVGKSLISPEVLASLTDLSDLSNTIRSQLDTHAKEMKASVEEACRSEIARQTELRNMKQGAEHLNGFNTRHEAVSALQLPPPALQSKDRDRLQSSRGFYVLGNCGNPAMCDGQTRIAAGS